tara:strand:- start:164 stop:703 length:540 start_codon:yes stop_codon:yes gene_type:complete
MKLNTLIIDDFLDNPDEIRNFLIDNKVSFEKTGSYPGKRTPPVDNSVYKNMIVEKLHKVLPFKIKMKPFSFSFQLCLSGDETWVHLDPSDWTGVLYLTSNAPLDSGTLFFTGDDESIEIIRKGEKCMVECEIASRVGNVYNRMLLFRGRDIPHRSDVAGFGDGLENGRLTQVFFFDEVR